MTLTKRSLIFSRSPLSLILLITLSLTFITASAQKRRPAAKAQTAKSKAQSARDNKNARAEKGRGKTSAREQRAALAASKREKAAAAARRLAEQREAARRAELARQAAIARQRAADQALRDEAAANIAKDDTTGEDMEVRRAALNALGGTAGTVVVMDPKTGRIYSIVNQDWALRKGYKPCSTIKLVTGLAGLTEKVIDPTQTVNVSAVNYSLNLTDSLAYSNNGYFQAVGGRVGFDRIIKYARELGLGERTGINHPLEYAGRVPVYKTGYAVNHMCSHGDDFEVTPIQLAALVSAIGNGGNLLVPRLPRTPQENDRFKPEVRRRLAIPQDAFQRMIPGMIGAVNYGTAKLAYDPTQTIAGKTGTCIGQGSWLGLFASYAPVANPRLAVIVVTRGSGARGRIAAGIAGRVYRSLNARFGTGGAGQLATTPASLQPRSNVNPRAAAVISDEEEGDDTDATVTDSLPRGTNKNVKNTVMTTPRPTEVTTRPAPAKTTTTTTAQPKAAPQQQQLQNEQRPRRVLTNRP